ncbi:hypothetical protein MMC25_003536 [Agyrium rufum]|nr:hypothetical protein [Agyrium rufum]
MVKRKASAIAAMPTTGVEAAVLPPIPPLKKRNTRGPASEVNGTAAAAPPPPPPKRQASSMKNGISTNPNTNKDVLDGPEALRASPDAEGKDERFAVESAGRPKRQIKKEAPPPAMKEESESSLSDLSEVEEPKPKSKASVGMTARKTLSTPAKVTEPTVAPAKAAPKKKDPENFDPEADEDPEEDEAEILAASQRPPPVNSDYLPLPWKGRLGYACLNTYLRFSNPPVFASRTCRIASILENRHPLKFPDEPPHATKNRPDKEQPADIRRGQIYVENLGVANARDVIKMLRWNDRYGIKFMRLSSEMFPFASHEEYGYKLAPFASDVLGEVGKVAGELGHRLTTHPGQFTQLGSPRKSVIENAFRDLDYHTEMLSLLKLPPQQNRDAVMILHLGGVFGDKVATLDRFRENYAKLPQGVKDRLVLENDDVSWSVHELLPICEELNIPFVLDFHHNNIIFDETQIREGTKDIVDLYPRILATWKRKNITPKMHYSEPTPAAITGHQRRKHSPRVATLPPCPQDMDLMIEAKDKEQAVFELMRTFKLPGHDTFSSIVPHIRRDDNKPIRTPKKKTPRKAKKTVKKELDEDVNGLTDESVAAGIAEPEEEEPMQAVIPEEEVGMGGPEGRVYWPPGMEDWLRPIKRVIKKKDPAEEGGAKKLTPAQKKKEAAEQAKKEAAALETEVKDEDGDGDGLTDASVVTPTPAKGGKKSAAASTAAAKAKPTPTPKANGSAAKKATNGATSGGRAKKAVKKEELTPSASDESDEEDSVSDITLPTDTEEEIERIKASGKGTGNMKVNGLGNGVGAPALGRRASGRAAAKGRVVYNEGHDEDMDED